MSSVQQVPLARMDAADPELLARLLAVVEQVARSGAFTHGPFVEAFERDFAAYCEASTAVGVSSGTDALMLALRALGVGRGDEVIVPANSFIATAEAVSHVNATPRFVDVDPQTHLMTAEHVREALGPRTRAVIPVHLFGATVDLDPILAVARDAGLWVIEDACQAHGARYRGRRVGTLGHAGCFSFYPAKNLGAWGDAGAVVTDDEDLADRIRLLRSHGERPRYHHRVVGGTARLDGLQAAVLGAKLGDLDARTQDRRLVAGTLRGRLAALGVDLPASPAPPGDHVFHLLVVRCDDRDALRTHLHDRGIATGVHYPTPIHLTPAYASAGLPEGSLPVAEGLARRICTLPLFPGMTAQEIDRVADAVDEHVSAQARVAV
ncbi:DegT/DnrJ/EryC1/StrS family aminotransferase [Capillimicrobium parvum]|nr:DegT/DnrJ/EryC1/StrS family aminotransferase [Capillimicrobium parvum]